MADPRNAPLRTLLFLVAAALVLAGCARDPLQARFGEAAELLDRGRAGDARKQIDAIIERAPDRLSAYRLALDFYTERRLSSEALRVGRMLEEHLSSKSARKSISPGELAEVHVRLGRIYDGLDRFPDAERAYRRALKLLPDNAMILNDLGYLYAEEGVKLGEALRLTRRAAQLQPDDGNVVDSLGWAQYKLGDFAAAAKTLRRAVELAPDTPELRYHLGAAYAKLGRTVEARVELEKSLALDPGLRESAEVLRFIQK